MCTCHNYNENTGQNIGMCCILHPGRHYLL